MHPSQRYLVLAQLNMYLGCYRRTNMLRLWILPLAVYWYVRRFSSAPKNCTLGKLIRWIRRGLCRKERKSCTHHDTGCKGSFEQADKAMTENPPPSLGENDSPTRNIVLRPFQPSASRPCCMGSSVNRQSSKAPALLCRRMTGERTRAIKRPEISIQM